MVCCYTIDEGHCGHIFKIHINSEAPGICFKKAPPFTVQEVKYWGTYKTSVPCTSPFIAKPERYAGNESRVDV